MENLSPLKERDIGIDIGHNRGLLGCEAMPFQTAHTLGDVAFSEWIYTILVENSTAFKVAWRSQGTLFP